ncbi:Ni/Fe hydrogenase subunit alpha [Candidatus Micrarchaeota archaeon]|nr:Ni/Fe hydrogenase subunit alpha [Candidatus Micrarchaeota archaeon]
MCMGRCNEITINKITKIEGHAKLTLCFKGGKVIDAKLDIFESPRFFEKLVVGQNIQDIPRIVSRICGICGYSHLLTSTIALENGLGLKVDDHIMKLRELVLLNSIMQSHALHLGFFVLPDMLNADNVAQAARKRPDIVRAAINIKNLATEINTIIMGRAVHGVTVQIGGFSAQPQIEKIRRLIKKYDKLENDAYLIFKTFNEYKIKFNSPTQFMALKSENGSIGKPEGETITLFDTINNNKKNIHQNMFNNHVEEFIVPYSTAKFSELSDNPYMVGALARININYDVMNDNVKKLVKESWLELPSGNPFMNNVAQAIEIIEIMNRSKEIIKHLKDDDYTGHEFNYKKTGRGIGVTEAPRGLLYHQYKFEDGKIKHANIIPPTSQNLFNMEKDIKTFIEDKKFNISKKDMISNEVEKLIRAYDPCVSCATHFLKLEVKQ